MSGFAIHPCKHPVTLCNPRRFTRCVLTLPQTFAACCGQGFAPWEIHRPQQAVRELVTRGAFQGSVLDCGSGIGARLPVQQHKQAAQDRQRKI
jgi:hypothetical protein